MGPLRSPFTMRTLFLLLLAIGLLAGLGWFIAREDGGVPALESGGAGEVTLAAEAGAAPELSGLKPGSGEAPSDPGRRDAAPLASAEDSVGQTVAQGAKLWPVGGRLVQPDGEPIEGLVVRLGGRAQRARSGADGTFELLAPAGEQTLHVAGEGYAERSEPCYVLSESGFDFGDVTVHRELALTGRVVDVDGQPVEGAGIYARAEEVNEGIFVADSGDQGLADAETDRDGRFRVAGLEPGPWMLYVRHPRHRTASRRGTAVADQEQPEDLFIELAFGASIAGLVQDLGSTDPSGLEVRARRMDEVDLERMGYWEVRSADIGQDGSFLLEGLDEGGSYALHLAVRGSEGEAGNRSSHVRTTSGARDAILTYGQGAELVWRAVDAKTGEPIESSEADLLAVSASAYLPPRHLRLTDSDGRGSFAGLWPKEGGEAYSLTVQSGGYKAFERPSLRLIPGQRLDLGDLPLQLGPRLLVRVVDAADGQPQAGARVRLRPMPADGPGPAGERAGAESDGLDRFEGADITDASGEILLSIPQDVRSELIVRHSGFAEHRTPGIVAAVGAQDILVELLKGGSVRVRAVSAEGEPRSGIGIEHRVGEIGTDAYALLGMPGRRTNAKGEVVFEHLRPGAHRFREAKAAGGGVVSIAVKGVDMGDEDWTEATVLEGDEVFLELRADPQGALRGKLTEQGKALPGAKLSLRSQASDGQRDLAEFLGSPSATTGSDGFFAFEELPAGKKLLVVEHAGRAMTYEHACELKPGEQRLDLDLPLTKVEGRVLDADGKPVQGARVRARAPSTGGAMVTMVMTSGDGGGGGATSISVGGTAELVVTSDEGGRYSLRGVQAGRPFRVQAELDGFVPGLSPELKLQPDQVKAGVEVALQLGGRVRVKIQTPSGELSTANVLEAHYRGDESMVDPRFVTIESSELLLKNLRPGPWEIDVRWFGGDTQESEREPTRVEVEAGGELSVTLQG